ncbi:MAG: hypothetical protein ABSG43_07850 [Solirubrobacteraceae bacterium]
MHGAPIYEHMLVGTVPVRDNVVAVQIDRQCCADSLTMVWYGADGQVIKRISNFANLHRAIASRSRRAGGWSA